jgi:calcineurin-like phosphoesterase family protein
MSNGIKKQFFTSDWHCNHDNVINFSNRPFKDIAHMHEVLINNYNATVPEDGICYFVGDMGMGNPIVLHKVINKLQGTKVLVLGNHDKGLQRMYKNGFDVVMYGAIFDICGEQVTVTHCPLRDTYREDTSKMKEGHLCPNWHGEHREKYKKFSIPNWGQYHLHGHIHSPNSGQSKKIENKQYDVGVDANNYRPVSWSTIESWIAKDQMK